eukprot:11062127-Lingulodinium_polyedra.AAC.1
MASVHRHARAIATSSRTSSRRSGSLGQTRSFLAAGSRSSSPAKHWAGRANGAAGAAEGGRAGGGSRTAGAQGSR